MPENESKALLAAIAEIQRMLKRLHEEGRIAMEKRHAENRDRLEHLEAATADLQKKQEKLFGAFPDGDPAGHCDYHKEVIELMLARKQLTREVISHLAKTGAWGSVAGLGYALFLLLKSYFMTR